MSALPQSKLSNIVPAMICDEKSTTVQFIGTSINIYLTIKLALNVSDKPVCCGMLARLNLFQCLV